MTSPYRLKQPPKIGDMYAGAYVMQVIPHMRQAVVVYGCCECKTQKTITWDTLASWERRQGKAQCARCRGITAAETRKIADRPAAKRRIDEAMQDRTPPPDVRFSQAEAADYWRRLWRAWEALVFND